MKNHAAVLIFTTSAARYKGAEIAASLLRITDSLRRGLTSLYRCSLPIFTRIPKMHLFRTPLEDLLAASPAVERDFDEHYFTCSWLGHLTFSPTTLQYSPDDRARIPKRHVVHGIIPIHYEGSGLPTVPQFPAKWIFDSIHFSSK